MSVEQRSPADELVSSTRADLVTTVGTGRLDGVPAEVMPEVQRAVASALLRRGALDQAGALLEMAARGADAAGGRAIAQALVDLAKAWDKRSADPGSADEAERALRRATEISPSRGLPALAAMLERRGRCDEAIDCLTEAIRHDPLSGEQYLTLGRLYQRVGQPERALATYLALLDAAPSARHVLIVGQRLDDLIDALPDPGPARTVRIALVGSSTLDHVVRHLKVECYRAGLRPEIYQGGFDQYSQEILHPDSGLYAFSPEVVICAIHASRLFPRLHAAPTDLTVDERRAEIDDGLAAVERLLDALTQRMPGLILLHNMVAPQHPALGIQDLRDELGQAALFAEINGRLADLVRRRYQSVHILDEDRVQGRCGKAQATDPRLWLTARMGWSEAMLPHLAREYLRYIVPSKGLNRKCIVLDLDNTLWGGIVGEDGLGGIQLGTDAPGNAFTLFQQALLMLWKRGILLTACSKNTEADALAVFDEHPDMVLRREHLAAYRINWQDKVQNIRELAEQLNIGLDSLVFLDDNPVERARVRAALPQVLTPELPTDPSYYRSVLLDLPVFETLALTTEDRNRNRMYAEEEARRAHAARYAGDDALERYLTDLEIRVDISPASSLTLPRLAQLTRKTNQFNATTRRYTEADLAAMLARGCRVYATRVRDRFGDYGVVGAAIVVPASSACWELDTLLLSCRAMGRGVESAMLDAVAREAQRNGATWLEGWIIPTERNEPVRSCYRDHGFILARQEGDGRQLWQLDLAGDGVPVPAWLTVQSGVTSASVRVADELELSVAQA